MKLCFVKDLLFTCSWIGGNGDGNGTPLQCSCLENPMDKGAWQAAVHGVAEGRTRLSDFTFTFHFMHWRRNGQPTRVLAWRIPRTGEPGGLPSMGSHRVRYDWSDLAAGGNSGKMHKGHFGKTGNGSDCSTAHRALIFSSGANKMREHYCRGNSRIYRICTRK